MKKQTPKFYGTVENGVFQFEAWNLFEKHLKALEGTHCEITCKKWSRQRSNHQNDYWWGVIIPILSDHFGYTHDEMHEALKYEFLRKETDGKPLTMRSTKDLTTVEFNHLIEDVQRWASINFGVVIPDPDKKWRSYDNNKLEMP